MEFSMESREIISLEMAEADHISWMSRVKAHVDGQISLDPSQINNHKTCRLGLWYFGEGQSCCGESESFLSLDTDHKRLHELALQTILTYDADDFDGAKKLYDETEKVSQEIVEILERIKEEIRKK